MHLCVCLHYLYLLLRPVIDPCTVSSALFDNDAAAYSSLAACQCVMMISPTPQPAVYIRLINPLVSGQSAILKSNLSIKTTGGFSF